MSDSVPSYLYDHMGQNYDSTRRADPYLAERLAHHLNLSNQGRYLDLACGTGNYTVALAAQGGYWYGVDQSRQMLTGAYQKTRSVAWCQADALALPFGAPIFSGAVSTCAIHHFNSITAAFLEAFRVIESGRLVIFTDTHQQMRGYWLNEYFPNAMEESIRQMPDLDVVEAALNGAGFRIAYTEPYIVQPDLQDFFLYSGKHHPEMYLSPTVRRGISTFSYLADPTEVDTGCQRLQADIESGRINQVIQAYEYDGGDYLFIVAQK